MRSVRQSGLVVLLVLILSVFFLARCASLQQKWDRATEDERARILIAQFQGTLKSSFIVAEAFVKANPKYQEEWKMKVLPLFDLTNRLLGDFIQRGKVGEKFTVLQVTSALAGRLQEIETILKGWGVKL